MAKCLDCSLYRPGAPEIWGNVQASTVTLQGSRPHAHLTCLVLEQAYTVTVRRSISSFSLSPSAPSSTSTLMGLLYIPMPIPPFLSPSLPWSPPPARTFPTTVTIQLPVTCSGSVTCGNVGATVGKHWNSMSSTGATVRAIQSRFISDGVSGGTVSVELETNIAGIYEVRLESDGVTARSVFVGLGHMRAASIKQLSDPNAIRNGSYTACTVDCGRRNISNIGRVHPQLIRVDIRDDAGDPVWGAQVTQS